MGRSRDRHWVEAGIVVGNVYDKYTTRNPLARRLVAGFLKDFDGLVARAGADSAIEVGCGEGYLSVRLARAGVEVTATDISQAMVNATRERGATAGIHIDARRSDLLDLDPAGDRAALVVCCEVLEHVLDPERALAHLVKLSEEHVLLSVPREPIWRALNLARLRYVSALGDTPGHVNHWSKREFVRLVGAYAEITEVRSPFPWTMVLCRT